MRILYKKEQKMFTKLGLTNCSYHVIVLSTLPIDSIRGILQMVRGLSAANPTYIPRTLVLLTLEPDRAREMPQLEDHLVSSTLY